MVQIFASEDLWRLKDEEKKKAVGNNAWGLCFSLRMVMVGGMMFSLNLS